MIGGNGLRVIFGSGDESASGQMIGFSQNAAGALMDGDGSGVIEEMGCDARDFGVMGKIYLHVLKVLAFEMASGDDP